MSNAIEHFSRCRVEDTTLQVMADLQRDLDRLIHEEKSVIRHYVRLGNWPHKRAAAHPSLPSWAVSISAGGPAQPGPENCTRLNAT